MNIFKRYIEYLKDNPEGYWFKRKLYGWGWTPARWQGWLVLLFFVAFLLWLAFSLSPIPNNDELVSFFVKIIIAIMIIIWISYKKGEKPKWQWGIPKKDSNQEEQIESHE